MVAKRAKHVPYTCHMKGVKSEEVTRKYMKQMFGTQFPKIIDMS